MKRKDTLSDVRRFDKLHPFNHSSYKKDGHGVGGLKHFTAICKHKTFIALKALKVSKRQEHLFLKHAAKNGFTLSDIKRVKERGYLIKGDMLYCLDFNTLLDARSKSCVQMYPFHIFKIGDSKK